jgi:enterochelin esterase family protein
MRGFAALAFAALALAYSAAAADAGDLRTGLSFASRALGAPLRYSLYLPDAYARQPEVRFAVIYLLHGYGGNDREWTERGQADAILDRLIGEGEAPPVIAVMPDAGKSWYVDSAALGGPGDYESAIAGDLIEHIDAEYRTISRREGRAIAGLSMGGYGALRLAFFNPERFAAAASLSGALYEEIGIPGVERPVATALQDAERWYHGAYGRPFDIATYIARNPFARIGELSRMQAPPEILITTGDDDYFKFYEGSCALFVALRRAGLAAELRVDDGGHDWRLWRGQFPEVLRFFVEALDTREAR